MLKKVYPAIFETDPVGYGIYFPDIEGAATQGADIQEGLDMATDLLGLMLADLIEQGETLPEPTPVNEVKYDKSYQFVTLVSVDLTGYIQEGHADKKTIKIPHWLNVRAMNAGINFSQTMTDALMEKLQV